MTAAWKVTPLDNRGKRIADPVYLRAATKERAEKAGRELLRMFGVAAKQVSAVPWSPETDHQLASFCRRSEVRPATDQDWIDWRDGRLS